MAEVLRRMRELSTQFMGVKATLAEEYQKQMEAERRGNKAEQQLRMFEATHAGSAQPQNPASNPQAPVQQTISQIKPPKIATPNKYNGTKGQKAEVFVNQVCLYMQMNAAAFVNKQAQVAFALSYLEGKASIWSQSLTDQLLDQEKMKLVTWKKFIESFKVTFFDSERLAKAEKDIRALTQTRTVVDYWIKFSELALIVKWPENVLLSQFKQGLKREITVHMVRDEFEEVEEMAKLAIKLDNEINKRNVNAHHPVVSSNSLLNSNTTVDPDAMDCSAYRFNISNDEYYRRGISGVCYNCGRSDHLVADCPDRKKKIGRGNWRGRGGTRFKFRSRVAEVDVVKEEEKVEGRSESSKNGEAWEC